MSLARALHAALLPDLHQDTPMALATGFRLGPYQIVAPLQGGTVGTTNVVVHWAPAPGRR